jgi:hypothetical protein
VALVVAASLVLGEVLLTEAAEVLDFTQRVETVLILTVALIKAAVAVVDFMAKADHLL